MSAQSVYLGGCSASNFAGAASSLESRAYAVNNKRRCRVKLIPRNVAALRRGQRPQDGARQVSGNPVSTRLESGVGNCFPGLECDLRNLERRFFPFLEVDIIDDTRINIV